MAADTGLLLILIGIVALSTLFTEGLLWFWAFKDPGFQSLKVQLGRRSKKFGSLKSDMSGTSRNQKKADRLESHLKDTAHRALSSVRVKQSLVMGLSLFIIFRHLNKRCDGVLLARLPFEPPALIRKLSHRNLRDPAANDCAFAFLYAVLNVGLRPNISKLLDIGPSREMQDMAAWTPPGAQQ